MTDKLLIERELLERIDETAICDGTDATISDDLFTQLVAALAAPATAPDGFRSIVVTEVCPESRSVEEYVIDADSVRASWRLIRRYREQSEALREECEHLRACQENAMLHMTGLVAERDTLRQQRDKLAGLLADVKADYTHAIHWEDLHATMKRIDAALAEVKPCTESPHPAVT